MNNTVKRTALFFIVVLISILHCACGTGELQSSLSSEVTASASSEQIYLTFRDADTDIVYSVIMEPNSSAIIGRKGTSDLVIADKHVSRTHCIIILIDRHLFVEDMDSTNGTFLVKDGEVVEITEPTEIKEGETLVLADVYLILESIK